ncbi:MAG: glycosyltransferase family 2 protein [Desulfobaccales bacterium]
MANENPLVSIIIPTYNRSHTILRSVNSVLHQTYRNFEIIIVDDGSTDNTEKLIMNLNSTQIKYIKHSINKGAAAARNTGVIAAKGEYIAFQDSDDEWHPDKLRKQIDIFQNLSLDVGMIYTDMWRIHNKKKYYFSSPHIMPEDGIIYNKALNDYLAGIGLATAIIRREVFSKIGYFDNNFPRLIDYEFFVRLSKNYKFFHIRDPLVLYYYTKASITDNKKALLIARINFFLKYFSDIIKSRECISNNFVMIGEALIYCNYFKKAVKFYYLALKINPKNKNVIKPLKKALKIKKVF